MRSSGIHSVKDATPAGIDAQLLRSGQGPVRALPLLGPECAGLTIMIGRTAVQELNAFIIAGFCLPCM
jgi:hypothetical protein